MTLSRTEVNVMSRVHKSLPDCSGVTLVSRPIVLFRLGCDGGGLCFNEHFIPHKKFFSRFRGRIVRVPRSNNSMKIALVCAICISTKERKKKLLLYSRHYLWETVFQLSLSLQWNETFLSGRRWETKLHFLQTQCTLNGHYVKTSGR